MFRTRHLSWAFCGLLVCASTAEVSFAQGGGGRGGFGGGQQTRARFELATLPEVQADLKLNDDQKKLASDQLAKQREKRTSLMPAGGGGGGGGGGGAMQAMMAEMTKVNAELDATFVAKLDDGQKSRMHGLIAQVNGAAALLDSDIAKALEVTEEQTGKLKAAVEASRAARREGMQGISQEDRQAASAKFAESESKTLLAILTEAQTKKFESLKGTALKIDVSPLRPARRPQ